MEYQTALLLHCLGEEAQTIYEGFHFDTDEEVRTTQEILQAFEV